MPRCKSSPRSGPEPRALLSHGIESLEPRRLLSAFIHDDLSAILRAGDPSPLADLNGPAVVIGDLDDDGTPDILVGTRAQFVGPGVPESHPRAAWVISGRTGEVIRSHTGEDLPQRFGASVAAFGDVDGDGVPDYGVGTGSIRADDPDDPDAPVVFVFSGATGEILLSPTFPDADGAGLVARAGDLDGDGLADILAYYRIPGRIVAYSADGEVLLDIPFASDSPFHTPGIAAGSDLDGDGVPDVVAWAGGIAAFSGATGEVLWQADVERVGGADPSTDFTGDGVPDVAIAVPDGLTTGRLLLLSGADGSVVFELAGGAMSVRAVPDVDGDGTPDLAAGVLHYIDLPPLIGTEMRRISTGGVLVVSGATGEPLSLLRPSYEAIVAWDNGTAISRGMDLGRSIDAADLNGDGRPELVVSSGTPLGHRPGVFAFRGDALLGPQVTGMDPGATGPVFWGAAGETGFLYRHGGVALLTELPGFEPGDRIIDLAERESRILIAGVDANGAPFVYTAAPDFTGPTRRTLAGATQVGGPAGEYADDRVIAAGTGGALLLRVRDGETPTAWLFDPAANTLTYLFDGTPVDISRDGVVVGRVDDESGVLWRDGETTPLEGLLPTAISPGGEWIAGLTTGDAPEAQLRPVGGGDPVAIPAPEGAASLTPVAVNDRAEAVGTFERDGALEGFFFRADLGVKELAGSQFFGAPDGLDLSRIRSILGVNDSGEFIVAPDAAALPSLLAHVDGAGPRRADPHAPLRSAAADDGSLAVVTLTRAGDMLLLTRAAGSDDWEARFIPSPAGADTPVNDLQVWFGPGGGLPTIAAATDEGLFLLEPAGGEYGARNLTAEAGPAALPIVRSVETYVPLNGLRIIAGLSPDGELLIYGENTPAPDGTVVWSYQNLFDDVVRAQNLFLPIFAPGNDALVTFVTPWGAAHIVASTVDGVPIAFWAAPATIGWHTADLNMAANGAIGYFNMHVLQTSWGGIHIFDGDGSQGIFWVPGFGERWESSALRDTSDFFPVFIASTSTALVTSWDAMHLAGVNDDGELAVLWWSPEANRWTVEQLVPESRPDSNAAFDPTPLPRVGLASATTGGTMAFMARSDIGELLLYSWEPAQPWELLDLTSVAALVV